MTAKAKWHRGDATRKLANEGAADERFVGERAMRARARGTPTLWPSRPHRRRQAAGAYQARAAMMSASRTTMYCLSPAPSNSVPLYFWYSTVAPTATLGATASLPSSSRPGPTATTCGGGSGQVVGAGAGAAA